MSWLRPALLATLPTVLALTVLACRGDSPEPSVITIGPGTGGADGGAGSGDSGPNQIDRGGSGEEAGEGPAGSAGTTGQGSSGRAGSGGSGQAGEAGSGQTGGGQAGGGQAGGGQAGSGPVEECPPVTYPSGVSIRRVKDAKLQALYDDLNAVSCAQPVCFLDASDLQSPEGASLPVTVKLTTNFTLYELIGTDIDPEGTGAYDAAHAYSARVLVDVDLVARLQKLRDAHGGAVALTSGYRSPPHQQKRCQSLCGQDQCLDAQSAVTCARNSRHLWGAAADMALTYEDAAKQAGFTLVFDEDGGTVPHLHVDIPSCQ